MSKRKSHMFVHRSELVSQTMFGGKLTDYMNQLRNAPPIDQHLQREAEHFGVAYDDVTPEQRRVGKALNYGAWYQ